MNLRSVGWMIPCIALLGGCSSFGGSQPDPGVERDLEQMKRRIIDLQEKAAMAEVELERLRQQVATLEARTEARQPASEVGAAEVATEPPVAQSTWQGTEFGQEAVLEESDLPIEQEPLETPPPPSREAEVPETTPPASVTDSAGPSAYDPVVPAAQALYDRGYTLYHQGRYLDAEASFQRFLQAYPRTDLSDNAQFWIGESRYARGDLSGALSAFRETLQQYPDGNKVPDALVKEGDCLAGMGDRDGARQSYEEVVRRFPGSAAAVMASERIDDLQ